MGNESHSSTSRTSTMVDPRGVDAEYRTVDLLRYMQALWRRRFFILATAIVGCLAAIVAALVIPPEFDAVARLQPPTSREAGSVMSLFPARNEGDLYLGFLKSRTVADDVIDHQDLKAYFHTVHPSELRRRLQGMSTIRVDKDQFITVTVRAKEPTTAVRIANEYLDSLYRLSHSMAIASAEHRWEYFEGPLEQEKNRLAAAEEDLKHVQQMTGMLLPDAEARAGVTALAQLKQQVVAREVELAALRTGSTDENPRVILLKSQIANLYGQVARMQLETSGGDKSPNGKAKLPELTLEVERKARDVKYHETLFGILSRQYENAKVDQSYTPPVEVVDRAVVPDEKSWPPRKAFALLGMLSGALLGFVGILLEASGLTAQLRRFFSNIKQQQSNVSVV